jgi:SfnB family sulfur acquisition oxidoreductase
MSATDFGPQAHVIRSDGEAIEIAHEVASRLAAGAVARDQERRLPTAELDELSVSGLLAITVPRAQGGAEVAIETVIEVFRIISTADPAIGQLPQNHFVFAEAIRQDGSEEQRDYFFTQILSGARLGNAQAERNTGSALDLRTRLLPRPDGTFRLDGTKYYCTGALLAQWIPVAAIDALGRGVLAYVRRDALGVDVLSDWNPMGQRVTFSGTAHFKDVTVPPLQVIPHWRIFERPNTFHSFGTLLHAAIDAGIARSALQDAAFLIGARKRPRLGAPVATSLEDPLLLARFGELTTSLHALEAYLAAAARLHDEANRDLSEHTAAEAAAAASGVKAFAEDVTIEISSEIFALIGSASTDEGLDLHRHWRNARTHTVHDANQWRYHGLGLYALTGRPIGKPLRRLESPPDRP